MRHNFQPGPGGWVNPRDLHRADYAADYADYRDGDERGGYYEEREHDGAASRRRKRADGRGRADQPDFLNAAAEVETTRTAEDFLDVCYPIAALDGNASHHDATSRFAGGRPPSRIVGAGRRRDAGRRPGASAFVTSRLTSEIAPREIQDAGRNLRKLMAAHKEKIFFRQDAGVPDRKVMLAAGTRKITRLPLAARTIRVRTARNLEIIETVFSPVGQDMSRPCPLQ